MVEHPITLKEYVMPSTKTTRQDYINDKNRKFGGSNKFSFRKYKTDKERLEDYLQEKSENQKYIDIVKNNEHSEKLECAKKHHTMEQPTMRYKPRTDLERIYYSVNEYSYGKISKDIVNEQLSKLHLNDLKKTEDEERMDNTLLDKYKNLDENLVEELQTQKEFLNRQGYNEKNSETVRQIGIILSNYQQKVSEANAIFYKNDKEDGVGSGNKLKNKLEIKNQINSNAAKKLMGEYYTKTFFKAASVFSINMGDSKLKGKKNEKDFNKENSKIINSANPNPNFYFNSKSSNLNTEFANKQNINKINLSGLNANLFTNTQVSGSLSNRTKSYFYLTFNEMDEPYYDIIQETKQNYSCLKKKNDKNDSNDNNIFNNRNENYDKFENIQAQMMRSSKAAFAKTANGSLFPAKPRSRNNVLMPAEINPRLNGNLITSVDFNSNYINFNSNSDYLLEKNCDSKSLSYLKNISAYNSLPCENREDDAKKEDVYRSNSRIRKSVKLNLLNFNASQTINNNPDGLSLRQLTHSQLEDNRKCKF
jgi:hypothetical protein